MIQKNWNFDVVKTFYSEKICKEDDTCKLLSFLGIIFKSKLILFLFLLIWKDNSRLVIFWTISNFWVFSEVRFWGRMSEFVLLSRIFSFFGSKLSLLWILFIGWIVVLILFSLIFTFDISFCSFSREFLSNELFSNAELLSDCKWEGNEEYSEE